jgi:hypothetical protein
MRNHAYTLSAQVAAEATRNGLPFNSIKDKARAAAPDWHEMQFLFTRASAQANKMDWARCSATHRRYDPPSVTPARRSRPSERSSCSTCQMQNASRAKCSG